MRPSATDPRKSRESGVIMDSSSSLIQSQESRTSRWTEYFRGQFIWSNATVNLPLISASETMPVHAGPHSETKVVREIVLITGYKTSGPDGSPLSFFKDDLKLLTLEIAELLESN